MTKVLITNVNIFDREHEQLATGISVLVEDNKFAKVAKSIPAPAGQVASAALGTRVARAEHEGGFET